MEKIIDALRECEEYFDQRADAEYFTDSPSPVANEEMKLLQTVRAALSSRAASDAVAQTKTLTTVRERVLDLLPADAEGDALKADLVCLINAAISKAEGRS